MRQRHSTGRGSIFVPALFILPIFALAACEAPQDEDWDMDPDPDQQEQVEPENDTIAFSSNLDEVEDSGISGEVTMMRPRANDVVTVIVELQELPREGEFEAHLFEGDCEPLQDGIFEDEEDPERREQVGTQVADLTPVQALADGTGMSQTTLQSAELPMQQELSVRVMDQGRAVACADVDPDEWDRDDTWNSGA